MRSAQHPFASEAQRHSKELRENEKLEKFAAKHHEEEIEFKLPDDEERLAILENNLKTIPMEYDLDLNKIVKLTKGLSGRDIKEKILKTALHNAIANDQETITMKNIEYSLHSSKIKNNEQ